jgi:hypothetical protein
MTTQKKGLKSKNGWIQIELHGSHYDIGLQHGTKLKAQIQRIEPILKHLKKRKYNEYIDQCNSLCQLWINDPKWGFIYDEIRGIADGAGVDFSIIFAWNMLLSLDSPEKDERGRGRCSAFIWSDGSNIIMAHNTHTDYVTGLFTNVVAHIYPLEAFNFKMQTAPGLICSSTDWFITSAGIIGCETTLKQTDAPVFNSNKVPYFFRIRKAMERGTMMDDYVEIMSANNAGDYGCQWLFGNVNTGHIMQLELTLNQKTVTMQTSGFFVGANMSSWAPETINTRNGARYQRLLDLIGNKDSISLDYAKRVLADHYDIYAKKVKRGKRTICSHKECEQHNKKNAGAVDGKVVNTELAKEMLFMGKFGSSCNTTRRLKMTKSEKAVMPSLKIHGWTKL